MDLMTLIRVNSSESQLASREAPQAGAIGHTMIESVQAHGLYHTAVVDFWWCLGDHHWPGLRGTGKSIRLDRILARNMKRSKLPPLVISRQSTRNSGRRIWAQTNPRKKGCTRVMRRENDPNLAEVGEKFLGTRFRLHVSPNPLWRSSLQFPALTPADG